MPDTRLFIFSTILITIGVLMSYSLGVYPALLHGYDSTHFLQRQFISAIIGIAIMWMLSQVDMIKNFRKIGIIVIILSSFALLAIEFLPNKFAPIIGGARRWIRVFGFSLSPIEFFKLAFVFWLSLILPVKFKNLNKNSEFLILLPNILIFATFFIYIAFLQNDLGQGVLLGIIFCLLLYFAGGKFRTIAILALIGATVGLVAILLRHHRIHRIQLWWSQVQNVFLSIFPQSIADKLKIDKIAESYQVQNAINAMKNGGFFGQGIGDGSVKLGFLSDVHTDMVLAGITEEAGFLGLTICFALFFAVIHSILRIAARTQKSEHFLFCVGVCTMISGAFFINALGIINIIPLKGIAVPFLTYGGSSLLANCISLGIVLSLSKTARLR